MAKIEVKLFIEESDLVRAEKALCATQGLEVTGPNAKKALAQLVKQLVVAEEERAKVTPPTIE